MDLEPAIDAHEPEALACRGVTNLVERLHRLDLRIMHAQFVLGEALEPVQRDEDMLIDRAGQHRAAMLPEVRRIIRAAAEEADANRCLGDDHQCAPKARSSLPTKPSWRR